MKKLVRQIALFIGLLACIPMTGQRYIDEIFDTYDVETNVVFGQNVNFLLTNFDDIGATVGDINFMEQYVQAGVPIPSRYFFPNPFLAPDSQTIAKAQALQMDIYTPPSADTETERPLAIYLHTGNFLPPLFNNSPLGSKSDSACVNICRNMAKRGYVVAAINYRLGWNPAGDEDTRRGTLLQAVYRALHDTQTGVRFLRLNAATYGIDESKIVLIGQGSGGYVSQAYTTLNDYNSEIAGLPKFINTMNGFPYVLEAVDGGINGEAGAVRLTDPLFEAGISKDVNMSINIGGAMADSTWLDTDEVPRLAFQCVRDAAAPFDRGTVIINVGLGNQNVVDVDGANVFIRKANEFGINDVFADLPDGDPYTDAARSYYDQTVDYITAAEPTIDINPNLEGCFPFFRPLTTTGDFLNNESNPWDFWDLTTLEAVVAATNAQTGQSFDAQAIHDGELIAHPDMSPATGMAYIDTIQGYMLPRIMCVLDLPENPCAEGGLANDAACDAQAVTIGEVLSTTTVDATPDGPQATCFEGADVDADAWYTFVAPASGEATLETINTGDNNDTQVAVYSSDDGTCTGTLTEVGCNEDIDYGAGNWMSMIVMTGLTPGETYWVQIDGWGTTTGAFDLSIVDGSIDVCPAPTAIICDNFDDYTLGNIAGQAGAEHWEDWAGSETSTVTNFRSFSNGQSFWSAPGSTPGAPTDEDNVLDFENQTTGVFSVDWMMYVPSDSTAYYNGQNVTPVTTGDWVFDAFFNLDGTFDLTDGTQQQVVHASGTYPSDTWFAVEHTIDLNNDFMSISIDGVEITNDYNFDGNLGGFNIYSNGATNSFYLDDVVFDGDPNVSVYEHENTVFSLFPNPTEGVVMINSESQLESIVIRDVLGAVVERLNPTTEKNIELDLSALETGIYMITVEVEGSFFTERIVKR